MEEGYIWTLPEPYTSQEIRTRYKNVIRGLVVDQVLNFYGISSIVDLTREQMAEIWSFSESLEIDHILRLGYYAVYEEWKDYNGE